MRQVLAHLRYIFVSEKNTKQKTQMMIFFQNNF